ncbi:prephenate dehydrogenase [Cyclobacterium plantarum]|uniref:Prephenate dehydrogenase n=1 Tax=Cyclobacterium plantarum TaxID=2716263 RepID=A0ABX0HC54_9BACT|nr:prephenate dehydrogenase [Cyclobacterium plantarum]NHE57766.1 prephenate dehydrogenase [Cyclobacterium plantarum]
MKKIHIIGLGLLGGSFALALKKVFPDWEITGFDNDPEHMAMALEMGLISRKLEVPQEDTDAVILATPVDTLLGLLEKTLEQVGPNTLVMDFGSTKGQLCRQMATHPKRNQYLAVHPIAGTENSGPGAAAGNLFDGKVLIICEMEKTDIHLKGLAYDIFEAVNMKLRFMDPGDHDLHLAFVSHLSHVSSFVLGKTVLDKTKDEKNIFDMAGSGFASTVRLAKSSPAMWAPIFLENKENVLEAMDSYIEHLSQFRSMIAEGNVDGLNHEMLEANKIRDILDIKE